MSFTVRNFKKPLLVLQTSNHCSWNNPTMGAIYWYDKLHYIMLLTPWATKKQSKMLMVTLYQCEKENFDPYRIKIPELTGKKTCHSWWYPKVEPPSYTKFCVNMSTRLLGQYVRYNILWLFLTFLYTTAFLSCISIIAAVVHSTILLQQFHLSVAHCYCAKRNELTVK